MEKIKVLIADDHLLFGKLISTLLESSEEIDVVGIAQDGAQALSIIEEKEVDILLLDINMPRIDGLQALKEIVQQFPHIKIIILSSRNEAWLIQKTLKSGASGYLTKSADDEEVLKAIMSVYKGESYCSRDSMQSLLNGFTNKSTDKNDSDLYHSLTKREKEILHLIADELTTAEMAEKLNISIRTVETHRKNILQKLGVKNTVGLMKIVVKANILEDTF